MSAERPQGRFITIEGGEGGGKSTQARVLARRLEAAGLDVILTREPGGTEAAERIRAALLDGRFERFGIKAEALLFAAARVDHLDRLINPALSSGRWVVCDRFHDSTRAYQGAHGGVDPSFLAALERVTLAGTLPDLTIILDLAPEVGLSRADLRRANGTAADRFERQAMPFHQGLREAFLNIASKDPQRCVVIDASRDEDTVSGMIWDAVVGRLSPPQSVEA